MATQVAQTQPLEPEPGGREKTIARLWLDAVAADRAGPAYLVEREGRWEEVSWQEAAAVVDELAHGLLALGIKKGDAFAILAQTHLEWALFDFALGLVGAIGVGIYANSAPKDCEYIERSPRLEHVVTLADLDVLRTRGRDHKLAHPGALERAAAVVGPEDLFTYIYTSGTTGPPKACM